MGKNVCKSSPMPCRRSEHVQPLRPNGRSNDSTLNWAKDTDRYVPKEDICAANQCTRRRPPSFITRELTVKPVRSTSWHPAGRELQPRPPAGRPCHGCTPSPTLPQLSSRSRLCHPPHPLQPSLGAGSAVPRPCPALLHRCLEKVFEMRAHAPVCAGLQNRARALHG